MGRNVERFRKICKEKGAFTAFLKTLGYLAFLGRKGKLEKIWKKASLKSGRLEIRGWNTGPRIFWDDLELTKSAGLNTAIFINGKWHDSSKAIWKLAEVKPDILILRNKWKSLPITQTWIISNLENGRVTCEIKLETRKDIEFIEQKFILMVSEKFNIWFDSLNKAVNFPQFKDWSGIKQVKKDSDFIGVQSDIDKNLPTIILKKQDSQPNIYSQMENSDFKTKAPLLSFVASSRDVALKYRKGLHVFFKTEIDVK